MAKTTRKKKTRRLASAKKRAEAHSQGFERTTTKTPDGMSYFKLTTSGMKRIDILPYVVTVTNRFADKGELHYEKTFFVHRIGPNGDSHICLKRTFNDTCPVCEHLEKIQRDPNSDPELVKSLRPKERQLFYVIDHDEPEKGVQLWDISYYLFGKQLDARIKNSEDDDGFDLFFDPGSEGLTLRLGIAERSFNGRAFYEVETVDFKPRKNAIDPELYENLPSLDSLIKEEGYEKLKAIFLQTTGDGEEEEEVLVEDDDEELSSSWQDEDEDGDSEVVASKVKDNKEEEEEDEEEEDDDDWDD